MHDEFALSRRRLLAMGSSGLALSVAGCSGGGNDDGDNGNGNGDEGGVEVTTYDSPSELSLAGDVAETFRHWLLPDFSEQTEQGQLLCQFDNFQAWSGGPESYLGTQQQAVAEYLGISADAISWALGVGSAPSGQLGWIYDGQFDVEAVREHLTETQDVFYVGPLEGYEALESEEDYAVAIGPETIIEHPSYDAFIEAEQGERERLSSTDPDASLALDVLADGVRMAMTRRPQRQHLEVSATSFQGYQNGQPAERIRTFVFDEPANATLANARDVISADGLEPENISDAEAAGRVFVLRYRP